LSLAARCAIATPNHEMIEIAGRSVLLVKRFDRRDGGLVRLGYLSAATILGQDPTAYATRRSSAEIAAKAREMGAKPCEGEVFRRLLFNCFIHNTDDHLRNTAFIRGIDDLWRISPAFDLVPHREARLVVRPSRTVDPTPDPTTAFEAYPDFKMSRTEAMRIYDEIATGLAALPEILDRYAVTSRDRETARSLMPAAFDVPASP
jgi:serine/threonine-protein kinase HipA